MAARARRKPRKAQQPSLRRRLARVERHVGSRVKRALSEAEAALAAEERRLARAIQAAERRVAAKERALARRLKAALKGAEAKAKEEQRKAEHLAYHAVWAPVDRLGPPRRGKRRRR